jgi:hypothetical protein
VRYYPSRFSVPEWQFGKEQSGTGFGKGDALTTTGAVEWDRHLVTRSFLGRIQSVKEAL